MDEKIIAKSESKQEIVILTKIIPIFLGSFLLVSGPIIEDVVYSDFGYFAGPILGLLVIALGIFFIFKTKGSKQCIYVTEKRVYGTTLFGKRVDIPLDSISAVSLTSIFSGVAVASSSGRISFSFLKNQEEIFKVVSELIRDRQDYKKANSLGEKTNLTDELKKYKELLDMGVITQEEFDAKKKELLGL